MKDVGIGWSAGRTYLHVEERNLGERIIHCRTRQQTLSSSIGGFPASALVPSISGIVAHGEFEELMIRTFRKSGASRADILWSLGANSSVK